MASLNLLSIPRELRNLIYNYLTREMRFNWTGAFRPTHTDLATRVEVVVTNVPIPSVLLAHSRLKDEYEECQAIKNVTMTLRLKSRQDRNNQSLDVLLEQLKTYATSSIEHTLPHIVRVVIFVDCGKRHLVMFHGMLYQTSSNIWPTVQILFTTGRFLPSPLDRLASLPLEQRAEAYRLSYGNSADPTNDAMEHVITKVGCYLFTKGSGTAHYWRPREVLPYAMRGWREKRGAKVMDKF
ncbi:hypothetical protein FB567DRAFT_553197 [Paraphoma chrysanthemicola]|uniref:Uncharacterized protein n=1 Tax=Paraphoma chrysanthemicola TaxID=798071 RepID=A0A8K0VTV1_9PLEO|nr:hypothetical protein FB567DRAFT_553197 [Paraphoma chrysanthemicola]